MKLDRLSGAGHPARQCRKATWEDEQMKKQIALAAGLFVLWNGAPAAAQALSDPVVAAPNPEALFTSKDPKLNRNKQAALHIEKDLLESHRWNEADKWLTNKYIQHNPQAASGLPGVVKFFTQVLKQTPLPLQNPTKVEVVAVTAEGDYVTVLTVRHLKDSKGAPYTTTWFDTWRFVDGKADEHWDPASLPG
jgi:predicted SnoaL-like aldol condensation-catalyzing enzyme